ncbi:hypothetical protein OG535_00215 [Kitasatospora sp. NBC_00085]|uniref:hypothetical protein n=1 Tax=unclassified Kitasatospora TaxID=2633591 RepID=UPI002F909A21
MVSAQPCRPSRPRRWAGPAAARPDEYRRNVERYQDQLAEQRRKRAEKAKAQAAAEARRRTNLRAVGSRTAGRDHRSPSEEAGCHGLLAQ